VCETPPLTARVPVFFLPVYVFYIILRINGRYFLKYHFLVGACNGEFAVKEELKFSMRFK